jgi:hypothetical protein
MRVLSLQDVVVITRTAKSSKARTRRQAWFLLALTDERLKQAARGELALAPAVKLPLAAVVALLWRIRKVALAQWNAASTPHARAAAETQAVTAGVGGELYYAPNPGADHEEWAAAKAAAKSALFEAEYDEWINDQGY